MVTRPKRRNRPAVQRYREQASAKTLHVCSGTLEILRGFAKLSPVWVQERGNAICVMDESRRILAKAHVNETFPCDFAIANLALFVRLAGDQPTITFYADRLVIADTTMPYCDPEKMKAVPPKKDVKFPAPIAEFSLAKEALKEVLAKAKVLDSKHVSLTGDGQRIVLKCFGDASAPSHQFEIAPTQERFTAVLKVEHIKALMVTDYWALISAGIAQFACANLQYFIGLERQ